jgi:tetratricopeptide (TPR) repeat protein
MRFTPPTIALASLLAVVSSVGVTKRPDNQIDPLSLVWQARGDAARSAGNLDAANEAYESALAADPRNRAVFVTLGDLARNQGLQGKAVGFYNAALRLEPTDMAALSGTVRALTERGAIANARENLSRMQTLCRGSCPEIAELGTLIDRQVAMQDAQKVKDLAAVTGIPTAPGTVPAPESKP